jgi:membrane protease YdiL (CAAX protease family)
LRRGEARSRDCERGATNKERLREAKRDPVTVTAGPERPLGQPPPPSGSPISTIPPSAPADHGPATVPHPPLGRVTWSPLDLVLGVAMLAAIVIVGSTMVIAVAGDSGLDATVGLQLVLEGGFFGTAVFFAARNRAVRAGLAALGLGRPTASWGAPTALAFLGYLAFAIVFSQLVAQPEQTNVADDLGFDDSTAGAISAAILIVIMAPIAEETFFRGFIFGGLRTRLPAFVAIVISGVLFGVIHLTTGNVAATVQLAVLGAVLAWLYERTGSIRPTIAVHMINNALAFAVLVGT